jgi:hypothetical protein
MAMPCSSAAATTSSSRHAAPGLDHGPHAGRGDGVEPSLNGKKASLAQQPPSADQPPS